jgi:hypothetical protein
MGACSGRGERHDVAPGEAASVTQVLQTQPSGRPMNAARVRRWIEHRGYARPMTPGEILSKRDRERRKSAHRQGEEEGRVPKKTASTSTNQGARPRMRSRWRKISGAVAGRAALHFFRGASTLPHRRERTRSPRRRCSGERRDRATKFAEAAPRPASGRPCGHVAQHRDDLYPSGLEARPRREGR